jgi:hypothetical protein
MKFRVNKGTPLFDKLILLQEKMWDCNNAAYDLVKKMGYKRMRGRGMVLAGGISTIEILGGKPEGWRDNTYGVSNEYFPKKNKQNKEILAKIKALPVVEYRELNDLVNFDMHDTKSNRISFHPEIIWGDDAILIGISSQYENYKPVKGMVEILESEYNLIKFKMDKKRKNEKKRKKVA